MVRHLWTSPPDDDGLDATLLQVDFPLGAVPALPRREGADLAAVKRINVIGHPGGGAKQFSLQDNAVDHAQNTATRLFYRSPTEAGSSGSPLFDNDWNLVGIHHGAQRWDEINRGIPLHAIVEALKGAKIEGREAGGG